MTNVITALELYQACSGPLNQSILNYPFEGCILDQPAKVVDFFNKIQYYIMESNENDSEGVSEPDPEQEAQSFQQRMARLQGNN